MGDLTAGSVSQVTSQSVRVSRPPWGSAGIVPQIRPASFVLGNLDGKQHPGSNNISLFFPKLEDNFPLLCGE